MTTQEIKNMTFQDFNKLNTQDIKKMSPEERKAYSAKKRSFTFAIELEDKSTVFVYVENIKNAINHAKKFGKYNSVKTLDEYNTEHNIVH